MIILPNNLLRNSFYGRLSAIVNKHLNSGEKIDLNNMFYEFSSNFNIDDNGVYEYLYKDMGALLSEIDIKEILQYQLRKKYIKDTNDIVVVMAPLWFGDSKDKLIVDVAFDYANKLKAHGNERAYKNEREFYFYCKELMEKGTK